MTTQISNSISDKRNFRPKRLEDFIGQVLIMLLFFASNSIYPIAIMPGRLQVISRVNPLSYEVDALRAIMLAGGTARSAWVWILPSWS